MDTGSRDSENKKISKKLFVYLLALLSLLLLGTTGYFFYQYRTVSKSATAEQTANQEEVQRLSANVGKLILLPKDETPTVATVTDIEKLKNQLFFKNAANGNKVLIYPNSKLAIIYDPKANIIVNAGPINFAQQPEGVQKTRIGLLNGTTVTGLTYKIETDIHKAFPELNITLKDLAKRTDYEKTFVVILNEATRNTAVELANTLNSQIDKLPEGEIKPVNIDILVIVGKDKS